MADEKSIHTETAINQLALALENRTSSLNVAMTALTKEARRAESLRSALVSIAVSLGVGAEDSTYVTAEIARHALHRDCELAKDDVVGEPPQIAIMRSA